jgi:hypothetical protein
MPLEVGQTRRLGKRDREKRTGKMINHAFCMSYCKDGKIIPILHPLLEDDNR